MHSFSVGRFDVHNVEEWQGPFAAPAELFADFDAARFAGFRDELPGAVYQREDDRLYAFLQSWILQTDDLTVLVDTGAGNGKARPGIPVFGGLETAYLDNLARAGFSPDDIDVVVNTHLHIDHVGWNTSREGDRWTPTFPRARYLFSAIDRAYWDPAGPSPRPAPAGQAVNENVFEDSVQPVLDSGRCELVDDGHRIAPGLTLRLFPGHTPGHLVLDVEDGGERALFVGDILHHPAQVFCPEWNSVYCEDAAAARASRRRVLEEAADSGARLVPAHFGGCHYVWVERSDDGFRPRYAADTPPAAHDEGVPARA